MILLFLIKYHQNTLVLIFVLLSFVLRQISDKSFDGNPPHWSTHPYKTGAVLLNCCFSGNYNHFIMTAIMIGATWNPNSLFLTSHKNIKLTLHILFCLFFVFVLLCDSYYNTKPIINLIIQPGLIIF